MSLKPRIIPPIPEATVDTARAAFAKGNIYLPLRDELGSIDRDNEFAM